MSNDVILGCADSQPTVSLHASLALDLHVLVVVLRFAYDSRRTPTDVLVLWSWRAHEKLRCLVVGRIKF